MHRFAIFVDGSNLQGSLDRLGINIDNYEHFFNHIFRGGLETWRKTWADGGGPEQQLHRVYWYRVGSIDKWNLDDPETRAHLRTRFTEDSRTRNQYLATVGPAHPGVGAP